MDILKILNHFLPKDLLLFFECTEIVQEKEHLHIYLDESFIPPPEHEDKNLESKGFRKAIEIEDFPIRENKVTLHVRRRKWRYKATGRLYTRDLMTKADGTSYTKEFADFLKEATGYDTY